MVNKSTPSERVEDRGRSCMCFNTKRILSVIMMLCLILMNSNAALAKQETMFTKKPYALKKRVIIPQYHKVKVKLKKNNKCDKISILLNESLPPQANVEMPTVHEHFTWIYPKTVTVKIDEKKGKIAVKKLTHKKPKGVVKKLPWNTFKSYMSYRCITATGSPQYKLQRNKAYTDPKTGVRMVDGRYCVAVGPKVASKIGTKIELIYKSGKIVPAIVADQKAGTVDGYKHPDGSAVEFVIDNSTLPRCAKLAGDMSALKKFKGRIVKIRVFRKRSAKK